jgi:outer membrane receptor protein involved in Fe transport
MKRVLLSFTAILFSVFVFSQSINGVVLDAETGEPLFGATIQVKDAKAGGFTNEKGEFTVPVAQLPVTLVVTYIGFLDQTVEVKNNEKVVVKLQPDSKAVKGVVVKQVRITEKQKESPLTVESLGLKAIEEAPAATFYESLGNLKGVDATAASLGFRVINTRGFNSTSPVRSLQLIDGVDNQSPGLNFSLGNFLGASDLDIKRVNIIAGASSSYYGPNAFNGVISMETKSPYEFPGLTVMFKGGERSLVSSGIRFADFTTDDEGNQRWGYKIGFLIFAADDWEAENYGPTEDSEYGPDNPGGYDAVNVYGDEFTQPNGDFTEPSAQLDKPGLGQVYRTGYREIDLVSYRTFNYKLNTALHYKVNKNNELIYAFNFGGGNTVYHGDNRYSLRNIRMWQNRLEWKHEDDFFLRFYSTNEDAGDSYDIVSTAFTLNNWSKSDVDWNFNYSSNWKILGFKNIVEGLPGYPKYDWGGEKSVNEWVAEDLRPFLEANQDTISALHRLNRQYVDEASGGGTRERYEVGTQDFDSAFNLITSTDFSNGGTRFYDKSALYHMVTEKKFETDHMNFTVGASSRLYRPDSRGTIFLDTGGRKITNFEYGVYGGVEGRLLHERLKLNGILRMDKNQNFDFLFTPAASAVFLMNPKHTFRLSFSSAIRNPTLADQYLFYNVGRAILLGNLNGYDSLITLESFNSYRSGLDIDSIEYFSVDPIRPEQARTFEIGYKGMLADRSLYVDLGAYYSIYTDFIGFNIGLDTEFGSDNFPVGGIQAYRVAANARDKVYTMGVAVGFNYYIKKIAINGNYSWNRLDLRSSDDPIIPAFNTPEHKFNIGVSARRLNFFNKEKIFGYSFNYKWIQGFVFEGSPQFTGFVPTYDMVDAQMNWNIEKYNLTLKIGGSNLFGIQPLFDNSLENKWEKVFDNRNFQVYGGPAVGRLMYVSVVYNFDLKKDDESDDDSK